MRKLLLFFFSHRTLALVRWDMYFVRLRFGNFIFNRKSILGKLLKRPSEKKYLNLGSGPRGLNDNRWINIDGFRDKNVHYCCDFNRGLPFEDAVFDGIFCEHVVEHFDYEHGKKLMRECLRVLIPGGVARIIVPDGNKILRAYFDDPAFIIRYKQAENNSAMEAVDTWFYQRYEHQCIYDAAYLTDMLKKAGFSEAHQAQYGSSVTGNNDLLIDDGKYSWESLYVEGVK